MINLDMPASTYVFLLIMAVLGIAISAKLAFRFGQFALRFVLLCMWAHTHEVRILPIVFRFPSLALKFMFGRYFNYRWMNVTYTLSETVRFNFTDGDLENVLTKNISWLNHIEKGLKQNCGEIYFIVNVKQKEAEPKQVRVCVKLTAIKDLNDETRMGFVVMDFGADPDVTAMIFDNLQDFMRVLQYYRRDTEALLFHNAPDSIHYMTSLPHERITIEKDVMHLFAVPDFFDRHPHVSVPGL